MQVVKTLIEKQHLIGLLFSKRRKNGRNFLGHVVVRGLGGGIKRKGLLLDFFRHFYNIPCIIRRIETDSSRTGFVFLVCYENGFLAYLLGVEKLKLKSFLISFCLSTKILNLGTHMPLKYIPVGFLVHNISFYKHKFSQLARSAGAFCQILKHVIELNAALVLIRLPSGEQRLFAGENLATIGIVSNILHKNKKLLKAGNNRWFGIRPIVRGVAKNPIDHPHGGNTSGGCCSVSPWGILTKGYPTRKKKNINKYIK